MPTNKKQAAQDAAGSRIGPRKKPHNVRQAEYGSLEDLVSKVATERRKAKLGGREVTISRFEGLFRVLIDRAAQGKVREIYQLLRIMTRYPHIAASFRVEKTTYISGFFAKI